MQTEARLDNIKDVPFFFILGSPRSGTTLLRFILDAHENIYIPLETQYLIFLFRKYKKNNNWDEITFEKLYHDLSFFTRYKLWKADKDKLKNDILLYGKDASYQTICKIIHSNYYSLNPKKEVKLVGDKNTPYCYRNNIIHKIYPEAKYIHLVRDYRGQVFSMLKIDLFRHIIPSLATRWKYHNDKVEKLKAEIPGSFITIRYEDLVDDVETTMRKICAFLDIEYSPKMILHSQRNNLTNVFNENILGKYYHSLTEPINKSKKEEWRKGLTEEQIKICDYIAGKSATKYNYFPEYNKFSLALKLKCLPGIMYGYLLYPIRNIIISLPFDILFKLTTFVRKYIFFKKT